MHSASRGEQDNRRAEPVTGRIRVEPGQVRNFKGMDSSQGKLLGLPVERMHTVAGGVRMRMRTTSDSPRPLWRRGPHQTEIPAAPVRSLQVVDTCKFALTQPPPQGKPSPCLQKGGSAVDPDRIEPATGFRKPPIGFGGQQRYMRIVMIPAYCLKGGESLNEIPERAEFYDQDTLRRPVRRAPGRTGAGSGDHASAPAA